MKNCERCNNVFTSKTYNQKYCSIFCYTKSKDKRHKQKVKESHLLVCEFCTSNFKSFSAKTKFCSKACISKATADKRRKFIDIPDCIEGASRKLDKKLEYIFQCTQKPILGAMFMNIEF